MLVGTVLVAACGQSETEKKRISEQERLQLKRVDSLALKIAVMPTFDCLPIIIAKERGMFDTLGVDVQLKMFSAQMDCDTAFVGGSVQGGVSDLVRALRLRKKGAALNFVSATDAHWQLLTNRAARIREIKRMNDKMIAITRFSATDMLADMAFDSVKLKRDVVYRPQINDVRVRMNMLLNNEMDAMLLPEPQSSVARRLHHAVLMDTRDKDLRLGVLIFRSKDMKNAERQKQLKIFLKAINMAVDSINIKGLATYEYIIEKYFKIDSPTANEICGVKRKVSSLERAKEDLAKAGERLKNLHTKKASSDNSKERNVEPQITYKYKFNHTSAPRQRDMMAAEKWLKSKGL